MANYPSIVPVIPYMEHCVSLTDGKKKSMNDTTI